MNRAQSSPGSGLVPGEAGRYLGCFLPCSRHPALIEPVGLWGPSVSALPSPSSERLSPALGGMPQHHCRLVQSLPADLAHLQVSFADFKQFRDVWRQLRLLSGAPDWPRKLTARHNAALPCSAPLPARPRCRCWCPCKHILAGHPLSNCQSISCPLPCIRDHTIWYVPC